MMGFLLRAVIAACGLWLASVWVPGVRIDTPGTLLLAGLLLGREDVGLADSRPQFGHIAVVRSYIGGCEGCGLDQPAGGVRRRGDCECPAADGSGNGLAAEQAAAASKSADS